MPHARPHLAPRLLACAAYSAALFILAGVPRLPRLPSGITDVYTHAVAYGLHALVLYWTTAVLFSPLGSIGTAWLGASAFGGFTELYQLFRPPRTAELKDLVADAVGAGVALLGVLLVHRALGVLRSAADRAGQQGESIAGLAGEADHGGLTELPNCIHCHAPIAPGAARCAHCLSWQSRWAGDSQNPRLELLLLGIGGALVAVLAVWLYAYGASKPPEVPRGFVARTISVLDASVVPRTAGARPAIVVRGSLQNRSRVTWRDMYLFVRCFDREGLEIDTFPTRTIGLVLPPGTDTPFKVIEEQLLRDPGEYDRCAVEVRWAQRAE